MIRPGNTTRLACALALLAVLLRVVLPALHDHHHHHAVGSTPASQVEVCSCGAVHAPERDRSADEEHGDATHDGHHCLACEIEEGTPGDCPPPADEHGIVSTFAERKLPRRRAIAVGSQVRLPQPRAPPTDEA